jgi:hypothetical protein
MNTIGPLVSGNPPAPGPPAEHPEFIPADHADAYRRIGVAVVEGLRETSTTTFLEAWWALCWLHPGLHPDDYEEWPRASWREFAVEAFRRAETGAIRDGELYPAEATRNRLRRAFCQRCLIHYGQAPRPSISP